MPSAGCSPTTAADRGSCLSSALVFALLLVACGHRDGPDPSPEDGTRAAGGYFDPEGFDKMGKVKPGEWLDRFEESGQTFAQYKADRPPRREGKRKVLVIQPIGDFTPEEKKILRTAAVFAKIYFQCPVRIARPVPLPPKGRRTRSFGDRTWHQYQTRSIFQGQLFARLPEDAIAYLGVTMEDIYPDKKWNYVFGEAYLERRVGVYSLARYFPEFWGQKDTPDGQKLALLRTFKVLAHETAHMFGLEHCIAYKCVVNGSNSLEETDGEPLHLCPADLRKLHWNLGFDIAMRYRKLAALYRKHGLTEQAAFVDGRLSRVAE